MNQRRRSAQPSSVWMLDGTSRENCPPCRTSERSRSMNSLNRFQSPVPCFLKVLPKEFLVAFVVCLVFAPAGGKFRVRFEFFFKPFLKRRAVHAHFAELRFAAIKVGGEFLADGFESFPRRIADDAVEAGSSLVGRVTPCAPVFVYVAASDDGRGRSPPYLNWALPSASNQHGQKWSAKPPGSHGRFSPWKCSMKLARTFFRNASASSSGSCSIGLAM